MKLSCRIIEDILPLYADGICSEESAEAVREHCSECENCTKKLKAMTAEMPEKKASAKKINPIKKIISHYLKIVLITFFCCFAAGTLVMKAVQLTAKEYDMQSAGESWSTFAYKREFKKFGRLFKEGKYYEAMSMADIKRINISTFTEEEQDMMYRSYAAACEIFFAEYPIKSYSVRSYNYPQTQAQVKAEVSFELETPNNTPVSVVYTFSKNRNDTDGRFSIEETKVTFDQSYNDTNTDREFMRKINIDQSNVSVYFPKFNYPDNWFALHFKYNLEEKDYERVSESFATKERQSRAQPYYHTAGPNMFSDVTAAAIFHRSAPLEENDTTAAELEKIFGGKYLLEDVEYTAPIFCGDVIYKGYTFNQTGCFMQDIRIKMKNGEDDFYISFSAPVTELGYIVLPVTKLEFSENTPEDIRKDITALFCEK